ncbi:MAG: efflux RND transporter periplasmic adaptor subunit [Rhizobiales bacterium]|nr:efflux RND transporter periplasmic adaptor subunit [Hyphomicrobiales bacterium]
MRRIALALVLVLAGVAGWAWFDRSRAAAPEANWRTAKVDRGAIVAAVSATGTINPISTVIVGSQMSGLVKEILVDFNSRVKAGDVVARLDDTQVRARLEGARADLAQAQAQVAMQQAQTLKNAADAQRARAQLADVEAQMKRLELVIADAEKTFQRQSELNRRGVASAVTLQSARTALDTQRAQRASAEAQIGSAKASIAALEADAKVIAAQTLAAQATAQQRAAVVKQIEVDLSNTEIRSPVEGVVVQRQIELGQTVAASLQAPTLFLIAQDLSEMEIYANIDETDVGRVKEGQTVTFTVNAYPARTFEGRLKLVRLGSQTVQNVVIYTAIVSVANPRLELKPGMTANLRIVTDRRENVLRAPNAALRWRPPAAAADAPAASNPLGGGLAGPQMGFRPPPGGGGRGGAGPMGELAEAIRSEIKPDAQQQKRIDEIMAGARSRFAQGAGEGPGADAATRRERIREAREQLAREVETVLTAEQKPLFEALRQRLAAARGPRTGPGGAGGGAAGTAGRVFVVDGEGEAKAVPLRLGATDGTTTEILSGAVSEGQDVIVGGGAAKTGATSFFGRFF